MRLPGERNSSPRAAGDARMSSRFFTSTYHGGDGHPNQAGQSFVATELAGYLRELARY